jgi:hypothetical protein
MKRLFSKCLVQDPRHETDVFHSYIVPQLCSHIMPHQGYDCVHDQTHFSTMYVLRMQQRGRGRGCIFKRRKFVASLCKIATTHASRSARGWVHRRYPIIVSTLRVASCDLEVRTNSSRSGRQIRKVRNPSSRSDPKRRLNALPHLPSYATEKVEVYDASQQEEKKPGRDQWLCTGIGKWYRNATLCIRKNR